MPAIIKISDALAIGLHAMLVVAAEAARPEGGQPPSVKGIAAKLDVSEAHLAKIMQRLTKAGLVKSVRGPKGGFVLATDPATTRILNIYEALEGRVTPSGCLLRRPVCCQPGCLLGGVLQGLDKQFDDYLQNTTIAQLADPQMRLDARQT